MGTTTRVSPGEAPAEAASTTSTVESGDASADHMRKAPPGWYYDPADEAIYRFWDGERWTDRLADMVTTEIPRPKA